MSTFAFDGNIYSADMLITWVNIFKPKPQKFNKSNFELLAYKVWSDENKERVSPMDILLNPKKKSYQYHLHRIKIADLSKPILVHEKHPNSVLDGFHRLTKAYMTKSEIKMVLVPDEVLKKCKLGTVKDNKKIDELIESSYNLMLEFNKRFKLLPNKVNKDKIKKVNKNKSTNKVNKNKLDK